MTDRLERMPVVVEVRSKRFDAETDRGKAAVQELAELLRADFRDQLPQLEKASGSKGDPITVGAILLALITSGAAAKALECVKTWLERAPQDREFRLTGKIGDKPIDLVVTARNVSDQHVAEIVRSLSGKPFGP